MAPLPRDVIDKVTDKGGPQVQGAVFDNDDNVFGHVNVSVPG